MGWLPDLLGFALYKDGVAVATRKILNFIGDGFTVSDDPANSRANVRFTAAGTTDPTTGFTVRLLPQVDTSVQTANATPVDVATIALANNTVYQFAVYTHAYAASYQQETLKEFAAFYKRTNNGPALQIATKSGVDINPLTINGTLLVQSSNNVIVRWTGHSSTTLKARIQVAYISRPVVLPS